MLLTARVPDSLGHLDTPLCLFTCGIVTLVKLQPAPADPPTSQQNVAEGPGDTCRLSVVSGSKQVPHLRTVHPKGTPFPSPAAGTSVPKIPYP